jgi:putative nucleotidyltransferase with HDIG domain
MNHDELIALKKWFADYCASFSLPNEVDQRNITVKQKHTHEVCMNAVRIAADLNLGREEGLLAEATALFHDIGRFPQYQQYKTFDDRISVNHAALGAKVLVENKVLHELPKHEQDLIVSSVTLHNVFALPVGLDEKSLLFARLIRDADKLDILRVAIEYFTQDEEHRAEAVALGLPDAPGYTPEVLSSLCRGEMARKDSLQSLNDLKLLLLAWMYDINFACSQRMILERDYIRTLADILPQTGEIVRAVAIVRGYVTAKAEQR